MAPKGARVLAGITGVPVGHRALGARVFTKQYQPEITRDFKQALLEGLADEIDASLLGQARASLARDAESWLWARWMTNFFAMAKR